MNDLPEEKKDNANRGLGLQLGQSSNEARPDKPVPPADALKASQASKLWLSARPEFPHLVECCMLPDPADRPQLNDILASDWVCGVSSDMNVEFEEPVPAIAAPRESFLPRRRLSRVTSNDEDFLGFNEEFNEDYI